MSCLWKDFYGLLAGFDMLQVESIGQGGNLIRTETARYGAFRTIMLVSQKCIILLLDSSDSSSSGV